MPRADEAVHEQPCRAVGCSPSARPCGDTPTVLLRVGKAGGWFTFLCLKHARIEHEEAHLQGAHSRARCREHAYEKDSIPGIEPEACNAVHASRQGRVVWGWST